MCAYDYKTMKFTTRWLAAFRVQTFKGGGWEEEEGVEVGE